MPKKKKCKRHKISIEEECTHCMYQEGICERCGKSFERIGFRSKWEEI